MANIKSAKKRIKVIDRQTLENKSLKTKIATYVKKYKVAVDNGDKEASAKLLSETFSLIEALKASGIVGLALLISMTISSFVGAIVPIIFKKINVDPAVASGPFITTINDLTALLIYYGLSALLFNILL